VTQCVTTDSSVLTDDGDGGGCWRISFLRSPRAAACVTLNMWGAFARGTDGALCSTSFWIRPSLSRTGSSRSRPTRLTEATAGWGPMSSSSPTAVECAPPRARTRVPALVRPLSRALALALSRRWALAPPESVPRGPECPSRSSDLPVGAPQGAGWRAAAHPTTSHEERRTLADSRR